MTLRALTFDFWDTIYLGASVPARVSRRKLAVRDMLARLGLAVEPSDFDRLYHQSAVEADRWWREEHRGYTTADRIRWMLARLSVERPAECEHIARVAGEVDDSLVEIPPPLLEGAAEGLRRLASRVALAIISDTGFASGVAQDRLLARDGLRDCFAATVYSMDVGHAKPRREMFQAALESLGVDPAHALHVGDNERTDVGGALACGMRAIRVDIVRPGGSSDAEYVATTFSELVEYLISELADAP